MLAGIEKRRDHFGAVFDGLFGVEGAVLSGDALADDTSVLVHENCRRRMRSSGGVLPSLSP